MLWWDWNTSKRLRLLAMLLGVAAIPSFLMCRTINDWRPALPAIAFFAIPLMVGWLLFVGLKTGRMPSAYGRSELRAASPRWFWITGSLYGGLLLLFLWFFLSVAIGDRVWGFECLLSTQSRHWRAD